MDRLQHSQPGGYLRFGRADMDLALGVHPPGAEPRPERMLEMQRAFLLSGANRFKALDIAGTGLGPPSLRGDNGISDREALDRLNAVGACFLEDPIFSVTAFSGGSERLADLLQQFFDSLGACHPVIIYKVGESPQRACKRISPSDSLAVRDATLDAGPEKLEQEVYRTAGSAPPAYPVIVLALGVPGRLLAARLMRGGFPGFVLDLDSLAGISFDGEPPVRGSKRQSLARSTAPTRRPARPASSEGLRLRWSGPLLGQFSFSIINRELCARLGSDNRIELSLRPSDVPFMVEPVRTGSYPGFRSIIDRIAAPSTGPAQVYVQNHVQHPYQAPAEGHWVTIQPWDYMSLPVRWVDWIRKQVDEVWVPSTFVRGAFLEAGIAAERVAVVPNGVDVSLYRPNARKVKLNTKKRFKFLFVGGPFWRKGFDVLLAAYGRAFTRSDDVSLVVKSVPDFWTSAGAQQLAEFRGRSGAPEVLQIVQSLEPGHMAGLYSACDCLVHPYRAEGFAICVAEAMASGLPVIVTGAGGTTDYCNDQTAFLLPATLRHMERKRLDNEPTLDYPAYAEPEVDALVERMRYICEHRQDVRRIANAGMKKIRAEFTWDLAADKAATRLIALQDTPILRDSGS